MSSGSSAHPSLPGADGSDTGGRRGETVKGA